MLWPIFDLNNWLVGGKWNQKVGVCFQAQESSRLTAMRFYLINKNPGDAPGFPTQGGYAGGNGGRLRYEVCVNNPDDTPGLVIARGYATEDPEYPEYLNNGGFPLVVYPGMPLLAKGSWYHLVWTNDDLYPTLNYSSVDFAYAKEVAPGQPGQNPDPTMWAWFWPAGNPALTRDNTIIPTPLGIYYPGSMQGNGGYQCASVNGVLTRNTVPTCWKGLYAPGPC